MPTSRFSALALASTLALGVACEDLGQDDGDADTMVDVLPQEADLRVNIPVSASTAKGDGDWASYYVVTRQVTEHVNGMVKGVLGTVWYVVDNFEPTWSDVETNQAIWGPWSDSGLDPVETGVWVRAEDDGSHTWAIFQVPRGGNIEDDAAAIVAGVVDAGASSESSSGIFVFDFDLAAEMDPAVDESGVFYVEYVKDPDGVAAVAAFEDFAEGSDAAINAIYAYDQDAAGGGEMDLAFLEDVGGSSEVELVTLKTRWTATGEGRADAAVVEGDLADSGVVASECWDDSFETVFWWDSIGFGEATGEEADCFFADAEYASESSFQIGE